MDDTRERAAKAAHEANAIYCESHGDQKPRWDELPDDHWMKESARAMVDGLLSGEPRRSAEAQHETWMAFKSAEGWSHGPTKDEKAKAHPSMRPYADLPRSEQLKDALAVRVASAVLGIPAPF